MHPGRASRRGAAVCPLHRTAPSASAAERERLHYALLAAVLISFATSVLLWFSGQREEGLFVGLWVPSILAGAAYFKLQTARK